MQRLIDADAIVYDIGEIDDGLCKRTELYVTNEAIAQQPTIDAEPVRHAKLLNAHPYGECSNCGYLIDIREKFNYCPNCGADMREES